MVCDVLRARAPAFGVKPSSATARSMRSRVSVEIVRLPESAYDTVERETPACRATSPIVVIGAPFHRRTGSKALGNPSSSGRGFDVNAHIVRRS
jgi:hypothetical protein